MATANNSECYLIRGVELDSDHDCVLGPIGSTSARADYFLDNTRYPNKRHYTNLSYIRPEKGSIRVNGAITAADYNSNYVMFRNQSHENKWFYGFVNRVEYVSDNAFNILFDLDPINTYMEQLSIQASHIIRAHQDTDNFGDNLEAEPFSPIIKNCEGYTIGGETDEMAYFIYAKKPPVSDSLLNNAAYAINNAIQQTVGRGFIVVRGDDNNYMLDMANNSNVSYTITCRTGTYYFYKATRTGADSFLAKIYEYIKNGYAEELLSVGMCPNVAISWNSETQEAEDFQGCQVISNSNLYLPQTIDGYTPHNKKCLTSQFNYIEMEGENVDPLYFEYSTNSDHKIEITYAGSVQGGTPLAFATPLNYDQKGNSNGNHWDGDSAGAQNANSPALRNQHRVTFTQYPTFAIIGSSFNQYWNFQTLGNTIRGAVGGLTGGGGMGGGGSAPAAQPATVSQPATTSSGSLNLSKSNLNLAKSAPAGGGGGAAGGGAALALQIGAQLVAGYQPTTAPTGGASNPSIESLTYGLGIKILLKQCIRNQIEKIDSFFDRYGYAINKCAIPNINARHYFTYVQLQNPDIGGDMPDEARQAFRDMLARGTTFFNTNGRIGVYRPATQNTPNS